MLLSAPFNTDHKEVASGLKASVSPSGKGCGPLSSRQNPGWQACLGDMSIISFNKSKRKMPSFKEKPSLYVESQYHNSSYPLLCTPFPPAWWKLQVADLMPQLLALWGSPLTAHGPLLSFSKRKEVSPATHMYFLQSTSKPNWGLSPRSLPCSAAACPIQGKCTSSSHELRTAVTPLFALTNSLHVMDILYKLECCHIRAELVPHWKTGVIPLFC